MLSRVCKQSRNIFNAFHAGYMVNMDSKYENKNCILYHQTNKYMTGPFVIAGGLTASAFGTYWALKTHFNPIKARSLNEVMKSQMIGQCIDGKFDIKLNPLNITLQKQIDEMRKDTIKKLRMRFEFQLLTGNLYFRPILLDETNENEKNIDTVKLMNAYGICHAFWVLNAGAVDYILDFVQEGIRFEMVDNVNTVIKEYSNIYIPCFVAPVSLNIGSYKLLDWIQEQEKLQSNTQYDLNENHCLHFADEFGQHFKPEIFHDSNKMSKFNTGIKHKSNDELLQWTKSVVDRQKETS